MSATTSVSDTASATNGRRLPPERRREALLDVAAAHVAEYGVELSIDQLAAAAGVSPPLMRHYFRNRDGLLEALFERDGSLDQYPDRVQAVSPLTHVDKRMPPVLIIHGVKDTMVTIDGSRVYVAALTKLGGTARLDEIPFSNHGTASTINRDATITFLKPLGLAPR